MVIRYADDLVALCHSQRQAEQVKAAIAGWLAPRGLAFNEDKTRIVHIKDGYDFLGFNVRRYNGKLLIKPSKAAIQRIRERLRTEFRALRGANAAAVIAKINPITRGWSAYYRGVVSSRIFSSLDNHLWALCYKWATFRHASKPKKWIVARYFGKYNKFRNDHWVFGDAASGAYLAKPSWTGIVRHTMVKGAASPDDPALAEYWATRRRRLAPPLDSYTLRLLTRQDGRCPICQGPVLTADQPPQSPHEWDRWWQQIVRRAINADYLVHHGRPSSPDGDHTRLIHAACQRELLARQRSRTACNPAPPRRLACADSR
jgi:RNA-directed DNA polymerase